MKLVLQQEPFDPGAVMNSFLHASPRAGAAVTFIGLVRSTPADHIVAMTIEHHPDLAETQIRSFLLGAIEAFALTDAMVVHRYGRLMAGEPIMQVITLAPHRVDAFTGAEYLMDYLKSEAPFWKCEETAEGQRWVDPALDDEAALARWRTAPQVEV